MRRDRFRNVLPDVKGEVDSGSHRTESIWLIQVRPECGSAIWQPGLSSDWNETELKVGRCTAQRIGSWGGVNVLWINQRFQGEML